MKKLNVLNGWANTNKYSARSSAQSYMDKRKSGITSSGCGSSCGSDDDGTPKQIGCGIGGDNRLSSRGSGCGASDGK